MLGRPSFALRSPAGPMSGLGVWGLGFGVQGFGVEGFWFGV